MKARGARVDDATIVEMIRSGASQRRIIKACGCNYSTIKELAKRYQLDLHQAVRTSHPYEENPSEEWADLPGFRDYQVSNLGNVRSWRAMGSVSLRRIFPRLLALVRRKRDGYVAVTLQPSAGGKSVAVPVHRAVLTAFTGPPKDPAMHACHNNGIRHDNRLENLRWGTIRENAADKRAHGVRGIAKIDADAARLMCAYFRLKVPRKTIAALIGQGKHIVDHLARGTAWSWVLAEDDAFDAMRSEDTSSMTAVSLGLTSDRPAESAGCPAQHGHLQAEVTHFTASPSSNA